jgi:hypothetical protein
MPDSTESANERHGAQHASQVFHRVSRTRGSHGQLIAELRNPITIRILHSTA